MKLIDRVAHISSRDKDIKRLARQLTTPRKIFDFAHKSIAYWPDDKGHQTIKAAWRSLKDGKGNCVDYAVLISALLRANGIGHKLRTVSVAGNDYDHIYIVTDSGKILDPVLGQRQDGSETKGQRSRPRYNEEVAHFKKMDYPAIMRTAAQLGAIAKMIKPATQAGRHIASYLNDQTPIPMRCDQFYKKRGDYGLIGRAMREARNVVKKKSDVKDVIKVINSYIDSAEIHAGFGCDVINRKWNAAQFVKQNESKLLNVVNPDYQVNDTISASELKDYERCLQTNSKAACDAFFKKSESASEPVKTAGYSMKNFLLPLLFVGAVAMAMQANEN